MLSFFPYIQTVALYLQRSILLNAVPNDILLIVYDNDNVEKSITILTKSFLRNVFPYELYFVHFSSSSGLFNLALNPSNAYA